MLAHTHVNVCITFFIHSAWITSLMDPTDNNNKPVPLGYDTHMHQRIVITIRGSYMCVSC